MLIIKLAVVLTVFINLLFSPDNVNIRRTKRIIISNGLKLPNVSDLESPSASGPSAPEDSDTKLDSLKTDSNPIDESK